MAIACKADRYFTNSCSISPARTHFDIARVDSKSTQNKSHKPCSHSTSLVQGHKSARYAMTPAPALRRCLVHLARCCDISMACRPLNWTGGDFSAISSAEIPANCHGGLVASRWYAVSRFDNAPAASSSLIAEILDTCDWRVRTCYGQTMRAISASYFFF